MYLFMEFLYHMENPPPPEKFPISAPVYPDRDLANFQKKENNGNFKEVNFIILEITQEELGNEITQKKREQIKRILHLFQLSFLNLHLKPFQELYCGKHLRSHNNSLYRTGYFRNYNRQRAESFMVETKYERPLNENSRKRPYEL